MADVGWATQKAIYAALSAALPCPVYDHVPQGADYPYVTFSSDVEVNDDAINALREQRFLYLSIWSTYPGRREIKEIAAAIKGALHRQSLPLEAGRMIRAFVQRVRIQPESDNETFMGMVTVMVRTQG